MNSAVEINTKASVKTVERQKATQYRWPAFGQHLHHIIDENGFGPYLYLSEPNNEKGTLLDVSYYRCSHCQAQYLVLYQRQVTDERPPFEPSELRVESIHEVAFDHERLLEPLTPLPIVQAAK